MAKFSKTYENFLVLGNFNIAPENENMICFSNTFCLENLTKEPTNDNFQSAKKNTFHEFKNLLLWLV